MAEYFDIPIQGDAEAMVVEILQGESVVTSLISATNISTDLVGYQAGMKWVMVTLEGGAYAFPKYFKPRLDVEVTAGNRNDAIDIINAIRKALFKNIGQAVYYGCRLANVRDEWGPARIPDKQTDSPRYAQGYRLTVGPG